MVEITGGTALNASLERLRKRLAKPAVLRVGFKEDDPYPDGTSVGLVAIVQEFGSPRNGVPPRPYFRTMIAEKSASWANLILAALKSADYDAEVALTRVGEFGIKPQLQTSIRQLTAPPLSPVTLMLRQMRIGRRDEPVTFDMLQEARRRVAAGERAAGVSTKPLIDSGHMINAVASEVSSD